MGRGTGRYEAIRYFGGKDLLMDDAEKLADLQAYFQDSMETGAGLMMELAPYMGHKPSCQYQGDDYCKCRLTETWSRLREWLWYKLDEQEYERLRIGELQWEWIKEWNKRAGYDPLAPNLGAG